MATKNITKKMEDVVERLGINSMLGSDTEEKIVNLVLETDYEKEVKKTLEDMNDTIKETIEDINEVLSVIVDRIKKEDPKNRERQVEVFSKLVETKIKCTGQVLDIQKSKKNLLEIEIKNPQDSEDKENSKGMTTTQVKEHFKKMKEQQAKDSDIF